MRAVARRPACRALRFRASLRARVRVAAVAAAFSAVRTRPQRVFRVPTNLFEQPWAELELGRLAAQLMSVCTVCSAPGAPPANKCVCPVEVMPVLAPAISSVILVIATALKAAPPPSASGQRDTSRQSLNAACSRLSTVRFAHGPKRSMGHVLGAEKGNFLIRGRGRPTVCGGRTG